MENHRSYPIPGPGASIDPCPSVSELRIKCVIRLKVTNKGSQEDIREAKLELTDDNNYTKVGYEEIGTQGWLSKGTRLAGKSLKDLPDKMYDVYFSVPIDGYLKEWYNSHCTITDIRAKIELEVNGATCEADLGVIGK